MEKSTYDGMMAWFGCRPGATKAVSLVNKVITYAMYVAYPCLLVWLFVTGNVLAWRALLVPAISFALVTVLRRVVNAPRPYEVFGTPSAMRKSTSGKSMPSRHVFSISIIAMTYLAAVPVPAVGIVLLALSVLLAAVRVVTGVHFVKDVVCGLAIGVACGALGFYVI